MFRVQGLGFSSLGSCQQMETTVMENQRENPMENGMETKGL